MKDKENTKRLMKNGKRGWLAMLLSILLGSCNNVYTPKPKAYPRVHFPEHKYELFNPATCPFQFEKPVYAQVVNDTDNLGRKTSQLCWMNVLLPDFNGTVNLTYKEIEGKDTFEKLLEDAHELTYKHTKKAEYINELGIKNKYGVGGMLYEVGGDAASNIQFYLTDSTRHFIRGALYFNNTPNSDSMAPVILFVKEDLRHMLSTFRWK
jgi:gliding motility-associated lipoprotein GldD